MTTLLEYREKIKLFFSKYDIYIFPIIKFLLALVTFLVINSKFGYLSSLKSPLIALLLALVCSLLPINFTVILAALMVIAHCFALSIEVCVFVLAVSLIMLLLFFRTAPKYGYLMIITPLAFMIKIPYIIPLAMGLLGSPVAAIPVALGTFSYYLLRYINQNTAILGDSDTSDMADKFTALIENALNNKEMILMVIVLTLTLIVVYVIRRQSFDYALSIAVVAGMFIEILVLLVGTLLMNVSLNILTVLLGCVVSGVLALALQVGVFCLDYSRTERVQFEDDDYYYYVKAVPKVTISVSDKKVKKINTRKKTGTPVKKVVKKAPPKSQDGR